MKIIGIIGAMEEEVEALKKDIQVIKKVQRASMEFLYGVINQKEVVVVKSGIGKVNAGICTQILVDEFNVNYIINTGIAGSLKNEINIGDIVVSTDLIQHDVDARGFGYKLGEIPRMNTVEFKADEELINLAVEMNKKVNPDINTFSGRVLSGDQFISDNKTRKMLIEQFGGYCAEMEGAAMAQVATLNNIPFVIIRAISDKADDSAPVAYETFEEQAIIHTVKLLAAMFLKMSR